LPVEESGDDERLCENVLGAVGADDRDLTWPRGRRMLGLEAVRETSL
jgi:hypothetical protein